MKGYCFRRKLQSACAVTVHFVHSNALRGTLPVSSNAALLSCLVICCGELRFLSYFVIIKTKDSKTDFSTTRGLKEEDMKEIARIMGMVARDFEGNKTAAQEAVVALTKKYPIYE